MTKHPLDLGHVPEFLQAPGERAGSPLKNPLQTQIGGQHYKKLAIQPVEYIHANSLGFFEGSVVKYITRWRDKGGFADLEKAKHFIDLLIQLESKGDSGK